MTATSGPETVASPLVWTAVPLGWDPVSPAEADTALEFSLDSIRSAGTPKGLDIVAELLSNNSIHPAALLSLWPATRSPSSADLYLLAVRGYPVSVSSARRILGESGASVRAIARALRALPSVYALRMADASTLENMERLLWSIEEALAGSDLTTARRQEAACLICARHNPDRFPATLNLGVASELASPQDYRRSWQLYRVVDGDSVVRTELQALQCTGVPAEFGRLTQLAQLELCIDVAHR